MKKAAIVSIGNELLSGHSINTNIVYLAEQLLSCGIITAGSYTVRDDIAEISRAISRAATDGDIVICTGGLGPTDDDLTRQGIAEFAQTELELDKHCLAEIESFFSARDYPMSEKNKIQAYLPKGAKALANSIGTAPGIRLEVDGKIVFALPGVPAEMKKMFEDSIFDELKQLASGQAVVIEKIQCCGIAESELAQLLGAMMERGRNPLINVTVRGGVITIHIIATAENGQTAKKIAEIDEKKITDLLGEHIFGRGEETLAEAVGKLLKQRKKTVATAESCTAGLLAKLLTEAAGSSDYFDRGWITYSNDAKSSELKVPPDIIARYGAVSGQVAKAMAEGAKSISGCDYGIGITGIAGPAGGSDEKPVGLVFIGLAGPDGCCVEHRVFSGDRAIVRRRAAMTALNMLRLKLRI